MMCAPASYPTASMLGYDGQVNDITRGKGILYTGGGVT